MVDASLPRIARLALLRRFVGASRRGPWWAFGIEQAMHIPDLEDRQLIEGVRRTLARKFAGDPNVDDAVLIAYANLRLSRSS